MAHATQITEPLCEHGEGPVWFDGWGGLRWVDMLAGDVLALRADGAVDRAHVGQVAALLRPRRAGGTLFALERGFATLPGTGDASWDGLHRGATPKEWGPELWSDPGLRLNEGGCDPQGRLWCGSMAYDEGPGRGRVYRLDPDGTAVEAAAFGQVTISNGLGFSPDGSLAYYVDSATRRIDVLDHDPERGPHGRRPLVQLPDGVGDPDGLAVDAEGHLWVALWGGGAVHRYAPDGALAGVVELPVPRVTACAFGGPGLTTLFVTTSRLATDTAAHPSAGAVFAAEVGVAGLPTLPYGG
ncbi:SMP-30/gluconolactonase/LRE family protein [Streptomyces sp. 3MP-14]|uniref:SMP-30/gluconolactonase/LRE family protein n=1 Tax=Streptomyces mimosae TaxID=2586635 RepID=A0A5N6A9F4_9ACTN|nr:MULTISPECIES: SMP-30/gluconolactonase/LRE family protein [Streptomyces]KAB8164633.1 SMP-30/gluconolactonase/LRE family protein [Streptomyces mimosae]KAB8175549.1 SMP-30/gluconolactonase/LRE family protein [Streptomyces sp. 3MP-14]